MTSLTFPFETTLCEICGSSVPESNLGEHMLADVRILQIIKVNRPEWGHGECEDYLRSLCKSRDVIGRA
jgi:hypothetical protein